MSNCPHPDINAAGFCTACGAWLTSDMASKGLFDMTDQQAHLSDGDRIATLARFAALKPGFYWYFGDDYFGHREPYWRPVELQTCYDGLKLMQIGTEIGCRLSEEWDAWQGKFIALEAPK